MYIFWCDLVNTARSFLEGDNLSKEWFHVYSVIYCQLGDILSTKWFFVCMVISHLQAYILLTGDVLAIGLYIVNMVTLDTVSPHIGCCIFYRVISCVYRLKSCLQGYIFSTCFHIHGDILSTLWYLVYTCRMISCQHVNVLSTHKGWYPVSMLTSFVHIQDDIL